MTQPEKDDENGHLRPKRDNPFVRFKNNVDQSVSTLLQGLIGLPSALSRDQPGNPRWADFDEDMRRRDELQARQKQLRDSESERVQQSTANNSTRDGAPEIPSNAFLGRQPSSTGSTDNSANIFSYPPLYAPVPDSLFFNLRASSSQKAVPRTDFASFQHAVLHHPSPATFHSQSSLLPYILFSPYSPLKLAAEDADSDYCEAFEDLIRSSNGRPMQSPVPRLLYSKEQLYGLPSFSRFGLSWLGHLQQENLLQQPQATSKSTSHETISSRPGVKGQVSEAKNENAQTEQDMYDRFLRIASLPTGSGAAGVLETLFADIEKEFPGTRLEGERALRWIFDELKSIQPEGERALRSLAEELFIEIPNSLEQKIKAARDAANRELGDTSKLKDREPALKFPVTSSQEAFNTTDKIVSTQTTSQHTTHDDGTVETNVTVWKRFADGRESVTTTSHVEEPARDEDGNPTQSFQQIEASTQEQQEKKPEQKSAKKGWFWN
jgi:hypothetical protein